MDAAPLPFEVNAWQSIEPTSLDILLDDNDDAINQELERRRLEADARALEVDRELEAERRQMLAERADEAAAAVLRDALAKSGRTSQLLDPQPRDHGVADSVRGIVGAPLPDLTREQLTSLLAGEPVSWRENAHNAQPLRLYTDDDAAFAEPDAETGLDPVVMALQLVPDRFMVDALLPQRQRMFGEKSVAIAVPRAMMGHFGAWNDARKDKNSRAWRALYARFARALIDARRPVVLSRVAPTWADQTAALIVQHGLHTVGWAAWGTHLAGPNAVTLVINTQTTPAMVSAFTLVRRDGAPIHIHVYGPGGATWLWYADKTALTLVRQHDADEPEPEVAPDESILCHMTPSGDRVVQLRVGMMVQDMLAPADTFLCRAQCYTRWGPGINEVEHQMFDRGQSVALLQRYPDYFFDAEIAVEPAPIAIERVVTIRLRLLANVQRTYEAQTVTFMPHVADDGSLRTNGIDVGAHTLRRRHNVAMVAHVLPSTELKTYFRVRSDGATNGPISASIPPLSSSPSPSNLAIPNPRYDGFDYVDDETWLDRIPAVETLLGDASDLPLHHIVSIDPAGHNGLPVPNAALRGPTAFYDERETATGIHFGVQVSQLHPSPDVARMATNVGLVVRDVNNTLLAHGIDMVRIVVYVDAFVHDTWTKPVTVTKLSNSQPITRTFGLHRAGDTTFALPYNADVASAFVAGDALLRHIQATPVDDVQRSEIGVALWDGAAASPSPVLPSQIDSAPSNAATYNDVFAFLDMPTTDASEAATTFLP